MVGDKRATKERRHGPIIIDPIFGLLFGYNTFNLRGRPAAFIGTKPSADLAKPPISICFAMFLYIADGSRDDFSFAPDN